MITAHLQRCSRSRLWAVVAVVAGLLATSTMCRSVVAATTTYSGTTGAFTIDLGDTAVLINGADITGDVLDNGTLQFDLSTNLTVSNVISGIGDVTLTNTGTITFSGSNSYLNGTTIRYGELVIAAGGAISGTSANMTVGNLTGESGTLRLTGGIIQNYDGVLGQEAGGTGAAYVTSGTWTNTHDLNVGYFGTGSLTIDGGSVDVLGSMQVGGATGSSGELTVSGGALTVGTGLNIGGFGGVGALTVDGGSVSSNADSYIGAFGSSGTASITSGTWTNSGNLTIGLGTLGISGDGVVIVGGALDRDPALGTINLGAGGTLVIGTGTDSGVLQTDLTNNGTLIFDRSDFSSYDYLISGSGAVVKRGAGTLQFSGSNTYQDGTEILDGRIDVIGGGAIVHQSATLSIGDSSGAIGGLTVSGGTVNTAILDVTNGDLNLNSGLVESGTVRIGADGTGTATISGGVFGTVDSLFVGYSGTGTMDVSGGNVLSTEAMLGTFSGDYGEVSVTNSGVWGNFGNLTVGGAGTGVLNISNYGSVLVTGTLSKGAYGTINLDADGILKIGNGGATGTLATDLTNNGLLEFNRSGDATYAGMINGLGAVTKLGTGSLTFSGSSSYTGQTTIDKGSFYIDGYLGNTAVVVNPGALLGGGGTVLGGVTVGSGTGGSAVLSPGSLSDPYAILSVGSLELTSGALTTLSVSGTEAGVSYDQISGAGESATLFYAGDLEITLSGSYADNTTFHLFTNFTSQSGDLNSITLNAVGAYASLSGTFSLLDPVNNPGVWATAWTAANQRLVFSTVTGDLIVVPEPSTLVMAAAGVGLVGVLRWRRRRQRAARMVGDQASDQA